MDSAPAILQAVMPQAERVRKPALQSPATHNPNPKPTHQATDFMSNSLINDPIGSSPTETTVNGIALRGAKSVSAHATSFSPSTWAARNEEQRPAPVSSAAAKGVSVSFSGPPSASMSRSSSRKSKTKTIVVPQLDDANEWPEVRDTLRPPAARPEKEIGGRSASASTSQKKEKTKWIQMPPSELQAALDANRAANPRHQRPTKAQTQSRSHSSPSHSLAQSLRSSPHLNSRPRLPLDDTHPHLTGSSSRSGSVPARRTTSHVPLHHVPKKPPTQHPRSARHRRPSPSKSLPVGGWVPVQDLATPSYRPLFGSFPDCLPVNSTPRLGTIPIKPDDLPFNSPPSPSLFSPEGPLERVTKQRGKVAIGVDSSSPDLVDVLATSEPPPHNQSLGQDQDGWFVVDLAGRRNSLLLDSRPRLEFGHFGSPAPPSAANIQDDRHQNSSMVPTRRVPMGDAPKNARDVRRGSVSENFGSALPYRHTSHNFAGTGTRRGGAGRARGHHRSASGYASARSISGPNYRSPPHVQTTFGHGHVPFDVPDTYGYQMMGQEYPPYYVPAGSYPIPPYAGPYNGYPVGMVAPGYGSPPNGVAPVVPAGPPIPMPSTPTAYQLDPLRFWLLGQIEYYFSLQNLATDLFLRRQMGNEGWIDISVIASFNRIQNLTQDYNLVRDTMTLSAYLEVNENMVRLAHRRWQEFVLPPTPNSSQSGVPSNSPAANTPSVPPHGGMLSAAAYSLATSLSNLTLTGDDAATIQAKVTEAVLGTESSMCQAVETRDTLVNGYASGASFGERDESASNTTVGSLATQPTPAATSPPSSPGSISGEKFVSA